MHILWRKWQETGWSCKQSFAPVTTKMLYKPLLPFHHPVRLCKYFTNRHTPWGCFTNSSLSVLPAAQQWQVEHWDQQIARGAQYFKGHYARLLALEEWQWLRWQQAYINAKYPATSSAVGADPGLENSHEIPTADVKMKLPKALKTTK